jgi:archaeal flagellin FlaB
MGESLTFRRRRRFDRDKLAQVGIGTMIVFIATILVAATAAALLLDTSGKLQEKASRTGSESTKEVASNLIVKAIYGSRDDPTGPLQRLNISMSLAPGANEVDLSTMIIKMIDGQKEVDLSYAETPTGNNFTAGAVRDPKSTFTPSVPVMSAGALVNLQVDLTLAGGGMELAERSDLQIFMIPEAGTQIRLEVIAPSSFGADRIVVLR